MPPSALPIRSLVVDALTAEAETATAAGTANTVLCTAADRTCKAADYAVDQLSGNVTAPRKVVRVTVCLVQGGKE